MDRSLTQAQEKFVESWGEMGTNWGINKTMARIHALLMITDQPLSTDDVMARLAISRGNANMNLRALLDWGLIRKVPTKGSRMEYFESYKDVWQMACRIARERKRRELEPVVETLEECLAAAEGKEAALFRKRLTELLELVRTLDFAFGKIAQQEKNAILPRLLKLLA